MFVYTYVCVSVCTHMYMRVFEFARTRVCVCVHLLMCIMYILLLGLLEMVVLSYIHWLLATSSCSVSVTMLLYPNTETIEHLVAALPPHLLQDYHTSALAS